MPTAALTTLGCKLNQYETEQLREQLEQLGFTIVPFENPADLYVINSCTVTHHADRDTRRLARRAKRRQPQALVVVTGCYAEVAPEELKALPEIDLICGNRDKPRLAQLIAERLGLAAAQPEAPSTNALGETLATPLITTFAEHTRAFIKIQEGCNARCAYCIIPRARGPSRSLPPGLILAQAQRLAQAGHPEIVLIGTHLGQYGRDLSPSTDLTTLIRQLTALPELRRLRLSSIEPCEITTELIAMLTPSSPQYEPKLCRHLHIPLQSGCDAVLRRMNRPYDTAFYAALIRRLHEAQPQLCLGTDVIVGFPGETEEEFAQTYDFIESLPLSYLHVFSFSPRRGTPAAAMPEQIAPEIIAARNHILRALAERKRAAFATAMIGQTLDVVLQTSCGEGRLRGLTDNYLEMEIEVPPDWRGRIVRCRVTSAENGRLQGYAIECL